jgi:hypothetical protein
VATKIGSLGKIFFGGERSIEVERDGMENIFAYE